ncbi:MAG: hypothetical protein U1F36_03330 [Planctomycetota bacterium]
MNRTHLALLVGSAFVLTTVGPHLLDELARRRDPLATRAAPRAGVVLCVGDSASFGVGVARGASWPELLAQDGRAVVSRAAPRLHAQDALRELPQWLAETHPEVVLLSVGADDDAVRPAPMLESEAARVGRGHARPWFPPLAALPRAEHDPALLIGAWRSGVTLLDFAPDGTLHLGDRSVKWHSDGGRLSIELGPDAVAELSWFRHRDTLDLAGPILGGPMSFAPDADDPLPLPSARRAMREGLFDLARVRLAALGAIGIDDEATRALASALDVVEGRSTGVIPVEYETSMPSPEQSARRRRDLRDAVAVARAFSAKVVIVGHAGTLAALDEGDRTLAQELVVPFVPLALDETATFPRTCLPTAAGHARIAALLRSKL